MENIQITRNAETFEVAINLKHNAIPFEYDSVDGVDYVRYYFSNGEFMDVRSSDETKGLEFFDSRTSEVAENLTPLQAVNLIAIYRYSIIGYKPY